MEKEEQRQLAKFEVATMKEHDRLKADEKILKNLLALAEIKNAKDVFCFLSASCEPNTITLVGELIKAGKTVAVPRCKGEDMELVRLDEDCDFKVGAFGIVEPTSQKIVESVEVCLTPLVAFDKNLNRLGKGKGFYDRYFAKNPSVKKIGVAYACQEVETVLTDDRDIRLDMVVTENGTITK